MRSGRERGFTLFELMIVIAVIAIIAAISIPNYMYARKVAHDKLSLEQMRAIYVAELQYRERFGHYAPSISDMVHEKLLLDPFKEGIPGAQLKGQFKYDVTIPDGSTADPPIDDDVINAMTRFRVTAQPVGDTADQRMKFGDQFYIMLEDKSVFQGLYELGFALIDVESYSDTVTDATIVDTLEPVGGQ